MYDKTIVEINPYSAPLRALKVAPEAGSQMWQLHLAFNEMELISTSMWREHLSGRFILRFLMLLEYLCSYPLLEKLLAMESDRNNQLYLEKTYSLFLAFAAYDISIYCKLQTDLSFH